MPQVVLSTTHNAERFVDYTAPTLAELREVMNEHNEGTAKVVQLGQAQDGTWFAVLDRALQIVLTLDDVMGIEGESQNEDSSDAVLRNPKINMSA